MTEEQKFVVERTFEGFELRRYAPHVLAEVRVSGQFESAGSTGFRPLVSYIGGRNQRGQSIAMTAPVIQAPDASGAQHDVAFVMPAGSTIDAMPEPTDTQVHMREVGETFAAAARFSGRWTENSCTEHANDLMNRIRLAGLEPTGPARFARYDPPWTPWFLRRNEVIVPVAAPTH